MADATVRSLLPSVACVLSPIFLVASEIAVDAAMAREAVTICLRAFALTPREWNRRNHHKGGRAAH